MKKLKRSNKHRVISEDGKIIQKRRVVKLKTKKRRNLLIIGIILLFIVLGFLAFNLIIYLLNIL